MSRVVVWGGADPVGTAELAMRRFGLAASLAAVAKPEEALAAARAGAPAVLALDPANPWWARLIAETRVQATDVLVKAGLTALALGPPVPDATGQDATLWATDAPGSRDALEDALGLTGFAGEQLFSAGGLKLFVLAGYVQRDDRRLLKAPGRLAGVVGVVPAASVS